MATRFEQGQHARDLKDMKQTFLQSCQVQGGFAIARDLECFDEGRNAGKVNVGDFRQVDSHGLGMLPLQHGEKPITQARRGIDVYTAVQVHQGAFLAVSHADLQTASRNERVVRQQSVTPIGTWPRSGPLKD